MTVQSHRDDPHWALRDADGLLLQCPPPATRYRTIVVDPPWPVKDTGRRTRGAGNWTGELEGGRDVTGEASIVPYERMSISEICALPVGSIGADDAHVYLWTTNAFIECAFGVLNAWGFRKPVVLTWCKTPMGRGFGGTYLNTTEFLLFARRGSLPAKQRVETTWFQWKRRYNAAGKPWHSAKPIEAMEMIESVSPGPYLELFARSPARWLESVGR
jgi:N6-adenosine-specific RNA methylase IME4